MPFFFAKSIVALKRMSDLFYCRIILLYAKVVLSVQPCHCVCTKLIKLANMYVSVPWRCLYISVDSILSRREGPAQGGTSWWREGGPFWSSQGGDSVRAMGPGRDVGG